MIGAIIITRGARAYVTPGPRQGNVLLHLLVIIHKAVSLPHLNGLLQKIASDSSHDEGVAPSCSLLRWSREQQPRREHVLP